MLRCLLLLFAALPLGACGLENIVCGAYRPSTVAELNQQLQVGDVVFVHVDSQPYTNIALATRTWVNHVGVVVDISGAEAMIAESTVPLSRLTPWSKFARYSEDGRIAVSRLHTPLTEQQKSALRRAAEKRLGVEYDLRFDLNSPRMYCSKYVHEVLLEASGVEVGESQTLKTLFAANSSINVDYWRDWYKGSIPWEQQTITPASLYRSPRMQIIYDGYVRSSNLSC